MNARLLVVTLLISFFTEAVHSAEPLPRIFYSPAERNGLAGLRTNRDAPEASRQSDAATDLSAAPSSQSLRLQGIATAASGASIAWINGKRHIEGAQIGPWKVKINRGDVTLYDSNGRSRRVRVGEAIVINGH